MTAVLRSTVRKARIIPIPIPPLLVVNVRGRIKSYLGRYSCHSRLTLIAGKCWEIFEVDMVGQLSCTLCVELHVMRGGLGTCH